MKVTYKMMSVILCGTMLLAAGCGAKSEQVSSDSTSEPASSAVSEAASESEPESTAASEEEAPAESAAVSEAAAESKEEPKAESKAQPAASSKETKTETAPAKTETAKPAAEAAPAQQAAPTEEASLETALKYVGKDVSKLYAAIGKPASSEYASSCMGDGEDGLLYYNGFTVTTYREGGKETVQDAY